MNSPRTRSLVGIVFIVMYLKNQQLYKSIYAVIDISCNVSSDGRIRTGEKVKYRLPIAWRLLLIGNALSIRLFLFLS